MVTKLQIARKLKFYSKPYGRQWKWRYQTHGYLLNKEPPVPEALKDKEIIDPLFPKQEEKPKWVPEVRHPLLEGFFPVTTIKDHKLYKETPIKLFDRTIKFHAGLNQVCLLTKTVPYENLPFDVNVLKNIKNLNETVTAFSSFFKVSLELNCIII